MEKIPDSRTTCIVKVIVNPRAEESFTIKWTLYPERRVNVKIITPNVQQLRSIVHEMKRELGPAKYAFRVQFNWRNVPQEIQKDSFKKDMYNLFQNAPGLDEFVTQAAYESPVEKSIDPAMIETWVSHVRTYIVKYGAHPDFNLRTPKGESKIHNYIKTVCARPDMTKKEALAVADAVTLKPQ